MKPARRHSAGCGGLGRGIWRAERSVGCVVYGVLRMSAPVGLQVQVWGFACFPCWFFGPAAFLLPAQHGSGTVGGLGGRRDAESLSMEGTGVGMGEAVGKGEGCPSYPNKSVLGVSGSKTLPSFVPVHLQGWRTLLGSRPHHRASS